MDVNELMQQTPDASTVSRAVRGRRERNGVTVIPVAVVRGGGGGGQGEASRRERVETGSGSGGGFGISAQPAGVYVIEGKSVRWRPAVDVNRIVLGAQVVMIVALVMLGSVVRHR